MSVYSNRLRPALQNLLQSVVPPEIVMHGAYIGGRFRRKKITRKASDAAENLQLYRVVQFFHPRSSCTTMHISADVQKITLNASCMTILGGRTKQLDIFCHVTGITSDFLSFIVVEHIWFFHGALQFICRPYKFQTVVSILLDVSNTDPMIFWNNFTKTKSLSMTFGREYHYSVAYWLRWKLWCGSRTTCTVSIECWVHSSTVEFLHQETPGFKSPA